MNETTRLIWWVGSDLYDSFVRIIDDVTRKQHNLRFVEVAASKLYVATMISLQDWLKYE